MGFWRRNRKNSELEQVVKCPSNPFACSLTNDRYYSASPRPLVGGGRRRNRGMLLRFVVGIPHTKIPNMPRKKPPMLPSASVEHRVRLPLTSQAPHITIPRRHYSILSQTQQPITNSSRTVDALWDSKSPCAISALRYTASLAILIL